MRNIGIDGDWHAEIIYIYRIYIKRKLSIIKFLKRVVYKLIRSNIQIIMSITISFDCINIHRFFDSVNAVTITERTTIPEKQTED